MDSVDSAAAIMRTLSNRLQQTKGEEEEVTKQEEVLVLVESSHNICK